MMYNIPPAAAPRPASSKTVPVAYTLAEESAGGDSGWVGISVLLVLLVEVMMGLVCCC